MASQDSGTTDQVSAYFQELTLTNRLLSPQSLVTMGHDNYSRGGEEESNETVLFLRHWQVDSSTFSISVISQLRLLSKTSTGQHVTWPFFPLCYSSERKHDGLSWDWITRRMAITPLVQNVLETVGVRSGESYWSREL